MHLQTQFKSKYNNVNEWNLSRNKCYTCPFHFKDLAFMHFNSKLYNKALRTILNQQTIVQDQRNSKEETITYYELELDWQMCSLQRR